MKQAPIFSIKGAAFSYQRTSRPALDGVNLEVLPGEWVALLGANGSGKSTLAKICNALLIPTQGDCIVLGMNSSEPENIPRIRRNIALVFQNPEDQIVASIVEEDVAFGPENLGLPAGEIRSRVENALELTGMLDMRRRGSYSLSGGQKQRLALAGALALEPRALVLDEATSMLDPEGRVSFIDCMRDLNRRGMTMIQITHRMEDVAFASRIVVLREGKVIWDGEREKFWGGEYSRFGLAEPQELAIFRELRSRNLVSAGTPPSVDDILEALCLLKSKK